MAKEKFYITTAIPYASRVPHIGNSYEPILTDAIARYKKLRGYDVYMCTGTDEHGLKVEQIAAEEGVTPKEHANRISNKIREIWDMLGVEYDYFIRTTDADHEARVARIFQKLYDNGDIYKKDYEGWYCVSDESFYTDSQVIMKDGVATCPDCGAALSWEKEEAYYFRLSKYGPKLLEYFEEHPDFIVPEARRNEMINNFLKPGLQDLCVTRSTFTWGVKVPFDPKHVVYVWIDALHNYITALGYDPDGNSGENFKKYWPADLHVIGKDIVRFHTIYWPAFLMAQGIALPKKVLGHPWVLFGTEKMSKSKGNVIYADEAVKFVGRDALRYYLLSEMTFVNDLSMTYEMLIDKINTDLANILGNLVSRSTAMVKKYFAGEIDSCGERTPEDGDLIGTAAETVRQYTALMDEYRVSEAIDQVFVLLKRSNKYIDETTPWTLAKDEGKRERLKAVLYNLLSAVRIASVLLTPVFPETAGKIFATLGTDVTDWDSASDFDAVKTWRVEPAAPLFARIDREARLEEIRAYYDSLKEKPIRYADPEPEISIEDFMRIDLRAAKILSCEKVEKSDKLLRFKLDLGYAEKQVLSGIAKYYKPEELVGKTCMVVANLKPAKLRGEMSEGMLLSADVAHKEDEPEEIRLVLVDGDVTPGSRFR
ncbi:MAG: methionine--tRNA ligase [Clostridia bacterium]|nr:methionine--tRNA ligase [Clostridia bacterium]